MQQKVMSRPFKKIKRSSIISKTLQNYLILKSYLKLGREFGLRGSPCPIAIDSKYLYYSKNTLKFLCSFNWIILTKAFRKNGLNAVFLKCKKELDSFDKEFKTYAAFLSGFENEQHAVNKINLIDDAMSKIKLGIPQPDYLRLITPSISSYTLEKVRIKRSLNLSDYELGFRFGWMNYEYLKKNGYEKAGAFIRKEFRNFDISQAMKNKRKNDRFIKNYPYLNQKTKRFLSNMRKLRDLDCTYYKQDMGGRFKSKAIRAKEAEKYGMGAIDVMWFMPTEHKSKGKIPLREKLKYMLVAKKGKIKLLVSDQKLV